MMQSEYAELTERQRRFIEEFLVDGNGTRAAVAAGYGRAGARVAASRTLTNSNVRVVLEARQAEHAARLQVDRDRAVAELLEAAATAKEQKNPAGMIAAWREIGRLLGFYPAGRMTVGVAPATALNNPLEAMSDEALSQLVRAGAGV